MPCLKCGGPGLWLNDECSGCNPRQYRVSSVPFWNLAASALCMNIALSDQIVWTSLVGVAWFLLSIVLLLRAYGGHD